MFETDYRTDLYTIIRDQFIFTKEEEIRGLRISEIVDKIATALSEYAFRIAGDYVSLESISNAVFYVFNQIILPRSPLLKPFYNALMSQIQENIRKIHSLSRNLKVGEQFTHVVYRIAGTILLVSIERVHKGKQGYKYRISFRKEYDPKYSQQELDRWFLTEIVGENLFNLLQAFIPWEKHEELQEKITELINFVITHLK